MPSHGRHLPLEKSSLTPKKRVHQQRHSKNVPPRQKNKRTLIVGLSLMFCLSLAGGILAQWRSLRASTPSTALLTTAVVPQPQPNPSVTLAKEYIYAGSRLLATEEPAGSSSTTEYARWIQPLTNGIDLGNGSLRKTSADAWDFTAHAQQQITSGNGYVEATVNSWFTGLHLVGADGAERTIWIGVSSWTGVYEDDAPVATTDGSTTPLPDVHHNGDRYRIEIENGTLRYVKYQGGSGGPRLVLYTSTRAVPAYPLSLRISLYYQNSEVSAVTVSGSSSTASNLAVNKPATQSSTWPWGEPSKAVDGNTDGNWSNGSVSHTNADNQAWWQVDLGGMYAIQRIDVWNRTDCCPERLSNFNVSVLDENQAAVATYYTAGTAGTPTSINLSRTGRYVKVQLVGTNPLSLAEVQVWGTPTAGQANSGGQVMSVATGADNSPRVLWSLSNGAAQVWTMSSDGTSILSRSAMFGPFVGWSAKAISVGQDNSPYLLWTRVNGTISLWKLNPDNSHNSDRQYGPFSGWTAVALDEGGDNCPRILWRHTSGQISLWKVNPDWSNSNVEHGPFAGWQAISIAVGSNNYPRLLWRNTDGRISVWKVDPNGNFIAATDSGPYGGWTGTAIAVGRDDNLAHVLWNHTSGEIALWSVNDNGAYLSSQHHGPFGGWTAITIGGGGVSTDGNNLVRLLWQHTDGRMSFWTMNSDNSRRSSTDFPPP